MQGTLPLSVEVSDHEILSQCKTFKDALRMAREKSGKSEKVVALELEERGYKIDQSTLSLSLSDNPSQKKNFPTEAINAFMEITNDIPLRFLALSRGFGLVRMKSDVELENEKLRSSLAEKEKELEAVARFFAKAGINSVRG